MLPFRLRIDATQPSPVWGIWEADGSRFEILWPPGFQLRTEGEPAVVDPYGATIGSNGTRIDDAGGSGGDPLLICTLGDVTYTLGGG